ncbi:TIGR03745 family integrating conjugative element membrane protein [Entomomonas sp. E2T0]|uniref:TIGR03745 family integrating conjugative element membrane protein n=1 Tax=Entomomonas sp. E2T0 TaxID=2930213 RepID=UPI00222811F2|nr:TIGR03745 family integrating conjugative element membrane protein [Entomomonas sp. E2T0]UYZ83082.1 TIGR03745 family integrating conjugative element membrane protein [Entomomonas sp. E2T0]
MLKRFKQMKKEHLALIMCALAYGNAHAKLPAVQNPNDSGGLLDQIFEWIKAGSNIIGIGICVIAFIAVAWYGVAVYSDVQKGKKTWAELGMCILVGAVLIVIAIWLLNQANEAASSR